MPNFVLNSSVGAQLSQWGCIDVNEGPRTPEFIANCHGSCKDRYMKTACNLGTGSGWELSLFVLGYQLGDMQNQAFIVLSTADIGGLWFSESTSYTVFYRIRLLQLKYFKDMRLNLRIYLQKCNDVCQWQKVCCWKCVLQEVLQRKLNVRRLCWKNHRILKNLRALCSICIAFKKDYHSLPNDFDL